MTTVEINNLKGIKHLAYSIPDKPGVFILSGSNGCGKTTLLIAIDRIGNSEAFRNFDKDDIVNKIKLALNKK